MFVRHIILLSLLFIFIPKLLNSIPIDNSKIIWNDNEFNIDLKKINSTYYIDISNLSKLLNPKSFISENSIIYEKEELKFSPGSFFTVYKSGDNLRISQMSLPVIQYENLVLIPLSSFLHSLSGIGLIKYKLSDGKSIIITNIFSENIPHKSIHNSNNKSQVSTNKLSNLMKIDTISKPDTKITKQKINNSIKTNIEIKDSITNPKKYYIPMNIKK